MKKFISWLMAVALLGLACLNVSTLNVSYASAQQDSSNDKCTKIYFTDDIHGNIQNAKTDGMSYATMKALKTTEAAKGNTVINVDAGDHVSGVIYANYDFGNEMLKLMTSDYSDYDFKVPGNHEFDYGTDIFFNKINKNNDYYACNFYEGSPTQRGENILQSYKLFAGANGEKIALIGIMTPETLTVTAPGYFQDADGNWIMYIDGATQPSQDAIYNQLNSTVEDIKANEGEDTICIGVGHLGNKKEAVAAGIDSETVVSKSHGLSAFIDAHSHTPFNKTATDADGKSISLIQAASGISREDRSETTGMNRIGEITISADKSISAQLLTKESEEITSLTPDSATSTEEKSWLSSVDKNLSTVIASNSIETDASREVQQAHCNNLADMVADAQYYYANTQPDASGEIVGADISLLSGDAVVAKLDTGQVSKNSCLNVDSTTNKLVVVEATGQQVLDALEFGSKDYPDPFGAFMQVAGCTYYIDENTPSTVPITGFNTWAGPPTGAYRVNGVKVYNKQTGVFENLDLNKTYKVAGFEASLAKCGNGYAMFKNVKAHKYGDFHHYDVLIKYFSDFNVDEANAVPVICSKTSALRNYSEYDNYPINYESATGADRIKIGRYVPEPSPDPMPKPTPLVDNATAATDTVASTGDCSTAETSMMLVLCLFAILGGLARYEKNWKFSS